MKEESEVFSSFQKWLVMAEHQLEVKLQSLKCDNVEEHVCQSMEAFLSDCGIISRPAVPHNMHQDGVVVRFDCTYRDLVRSMLERCKLPKRFGRMRVVLQRS